MIRFACPGCDARFTIDDDQAGKPGECPSCRARFRIPEAAERPDEPPPATPSPSPVGVAVCPHCQQKSRVAPEDAGHPVACPCCGEAFTPGEAVATAADGPLPRRRRSQRDWGDDRLGGVRVIYRDRDRQPGQVRTAGYLLMVGGIYGLVHLAGMMVSSYCCCSLYPPVIVGFVWAILAIVRASAYLGDSAASAGNPQSLQVVQLLLILNLDVVNFILGLTGLILCNADEVREFFAAGGAYADDD